jgi:hypothetical protein
MEHFDKRRVCYNKKSCPFSDLWTHLKKKKPEKLDFFSKKSKDNLESKTTCQFYRMKLKNWSWKLYSCRTISVFIVLIRWSSMYKDDMLPVFLILYLGSVDNKSLAF